MGLARRSGAPIRTRLRMSFWTSVGVGGALGLLCSFARDEFREEQGMARRSQGSRLDGGAATWPRGSSYTPRGQRRLESKDLFPEDAIIDKPYEDDPLRGLVFLHVIGILYMLLGLNTVCDIYFTGSLEVMVERWQIKPDVAGATFMAAGGSAPELFTSLIGTTIAHNDVGFSTIVGSAVFNVLFVIGLCGYVSKTAIQLTWWPLFRDCSCYIVGLTLLAVLSWDGSIAVWEAAVLFCAYLLYLFVMYFNMELEELVVSRLSRHKVSDSEGVAAGDMAEGQTSPPDAGDNQNTERTCRKEDAQPQEHVQAWSCNDGADELKKTARSTSPPKTPEVVEIEYTDLESTEAHPLDVKETQTPITVLQKETATAGISAVEVSITARSQQQEDDIETDARDAAQTTLTMEVEDDGDLMAMPEGYLDRFIWCMSLVVYVPLYYSMPKPSERHFLVTFGFSLVWIAGFSFLLVWWVDTIGKVLGISEVVMGFTFLAAGTSIPDAASSVAVAKAGEGDMAVSSSIGSNIFDILVGLPVPWMIKAGIIEGLIRSNSEYRVCIYSPFMGFYVLLLMIMVLCTILSIHMLGWKLNKALGLAMAGLYLVFIAVALSVESERPRDLRFGRDDSSATCA